jgi:hypothetical protein
MLPARNGPKLGYNPRTVFVATSTVTRSAATVVAAAVVSVPSAIKPAAVKKPWSFTG